MPTSVRAAGLVLLTLLLGAAACTHRQGSEGDGPVAHLAREVPEPIPELGERADTTDAGRPCLSRQDEPKLSCRTTRAEVIACHARGPCCALTHEVRMPRCQGIAEALPRAREPAPPPCVCSCSPAYELWTAEVQRRVHECASVP